MGILDQLEAFIIEEEKGAKEYNLFIDTISSEKSLSLEKKTEFKSMIASIAEDELKHGRLLKRMKNQTGFKDTPIEATTCSVLRVGSKVKDNFGFSGTLSRKEGATCFIEYDCFPGKTMPVEANRVKLAEEPIIRPITYDPALKKPTKDVTTPKEIEFLEGQAKEALTKIYNRSHEIRRLKEEVAKIQADFKKEKLESNPELEGYFEMAEKSFKKAGLALNTTYALKAEEEVILVAIRHSGRQEPSQPLQTKDAQTILDLLRQAGKVTDEMVAEMEEQVDKLNEGITMQTIIEREIKTWPASEKDIKILKTTATSKIATFREWLKSAWKGASEFFGFMEKATEEYTDLIAKVFELAK